MSTGPGRELRRHYPNFGLLRLLLAMFVIVSHSAPLVEGDNRHELLSRVTGTTTFGELAVDLFLAASGLLVAQSLERSGLARYLANRVRRIFPGFIVASLLSAAVAVACGGKAALSSSSSRWGCSASRRSRMLLPATRSRSPTDRCGRSATSSSAT